MARSKVNKDPRGNHELHITAFQGKYVVSFVHASATHATDSTPLRDLKLKVLARLD